MSGRVWLKAAGCAALAVGAAAVSPESGALTAAAISASLGAGAAGNLFHELFGKGEDQFAELFAGRRAIDENHHVLLALRQAHLRALAVVVEDFAGAKPSDLVVALRKYLEEAGAEEAAVSAGEISAFENSIFDRLSESFDLALAARGQTGSGRDTHDVSAVEAAEARREIETAALAELAAAVGFDAFPEAFEARFRSEGGGWFDLFVRDAADRLKTNDAFLRIWQSEKLARITVEVVRMADTLTKIHETTTRIDETTVRTEAKLDAHEEVSERRHKEVLAAISLEKGVPEESLRPILERLGHTNVPMADIPRVLGEAVDALRERSHELTFIHNDGAAIDEAIREAREKLADADAAGALDVLAEALAEDDAYVRALKAADEAQAHLAAMARARARALFEQAFIQRTTFDHVGAIASLKAGLALDGDIPWRWLDLGDELRLFGYLEEAGQAFAAGGDAAGRTGDQRDLAAAFSRVGNVRVAQGRLDDALKSYRDSLAIAQKLTASDPGNAQWRRDLSVSFEKIGDVQVAQGLLDDALKSFRDGLAITEKLAASDPGNAEWRRDLSVSFNKIGEVHVAQGRLDAALKRFRDGIAISEKLAASDPGNAQWRRDLSVSFNKIGGVQVAQGRLDDALTSFQDGLTIREKLTADDPGNAEWQRDLSVSFEKIGDVQVAQVGSTRR